MPVTTAVVGIDAALPPIDPYTCNPVPGYIAVSMLPGVSDDLHTNSYTPPRLGRVTE